MIDLNNRSELLKLDTTGAIDSIEQLPAQCEQAWREVNQIVLPENYTQVQNVVVCGMGGSWLGTHIIQCLFTEQLRTPLIVSHDYQIPAFVNEKTLVIASSYSGTTEETIAGLNQAFTQKAKIITISTGGNLAEFAKANHLPNYTFIGTHNPVKSPRLGLGYSVMAQMAIFCKLGLITVKPEEVTNIINHLQKRVSDLNPETKNNEAKQMARKLFGFMPIVVSGNFLLGVAHAFSNQFNETAKTFGTFMHIPELNHHLMEGLTHPVEVTKLKFLFIESRLYDSRVQLRFKVTKDVVEQNKISYLSYLTVGDTKRMQAFDTLLFGSFVTYYLAMLYSVNPAPNPWVDYFKKKLKVLSK